MRTLNKEQHSDPVPSEIGCPHPWASLIRKPIQRDLACTARLLANVHKLKVRNSISKLAQRELRLVADFLNSLKIPFFFVGRDDGQSVIVPRCGPSRERVLSLLDHSAPETPSETPSEKDSEKLNRIWVAVQILLDELKARDDISFVLVWESQRSSIPEFDFSLDYDRQTAWSALRQLLIAEDRSRVLREPPPSPMEFDVPRIEPAVPHSVDSGIQVVPWPDFQRHNFDRHLDWRWRRAFALVQNGKVFDDRFDDSETGAAVRFLRESLRPRQDSAKLAKMPDLLAAHQILTGPTDRRVELEARLLARQSSQQIAERLSTSAETIEAYTSLFFDVRGRLDSKTYIVKKAVGSDLDSGWGLIGQGLTPAELAKGIAYSAGPIVLDRVLPYLTEKGGPSAAQNAAKPPSDPIADRLDLILQAGNLPNDVDTAAQLVRVADQLMGDLPKLKPIQRWAGVFTQVVGPFKGHVFTRRKSRAQQIRVGTTDRKAA